MLANVIMDLCLFGFGHKAVLISAVKRLDKFSRIFVYMQGDIEHFVFALPNEETKLNTYQCNFIIIVYLYVHDCNICKFWIQYTIIYVV